MANRARFGRIVGAALALLVAGAGTRALAADEAGGGQDASGQAAPKHHSKAKGAVVGGVGGGLVGGKKGAAAGAAGGALWQHHKNKKEAKEAEKGKGQ